jgi:AcrR family transcriptional regulator
MRYEQLSLWSQWLTAFSARLRPLFLGHSRRLAQETVSWLRCSGIDLESLWRSTTRWLRNTFGGNLLPAADGCASRSCAKYGEIWRFEELDASVTIRQNLTRSSRSMSTDLEYANKREQTKARNRAVILDAARSVFVDLGYDAATIRDIVARTQLAPGTFYNYFPDKRSVLVALMAEASAQATDRARDARSRAGSLEELVYFGFRAYFEFIASDPTMFELMRRNASTLRTLGIDETGFATSIAELRADLQAAITRGTLPTIDLRYVPSAVTAIAFEVGAEMATSTPPDVEGATEFCARLCLGGIEQLKRTVRNKEKT